MSDQDLKQGVKLLEERVAALEGKVQVQQKDFDTKLKIFSLLNKAQLFINTAVPFVVKPEELFPRKPGNNIFSKRNSNV